MVSLAVFAILLGLATMSFSRLDQKSFLIEPATEIELLAGRSLRKAVTQGREVEIPISTTSVGGVEIPRELSLTVRPWGRDQWVSPRGYSWAFGPSGICEPLSLRLERGVAYVELDFHPLTAMVSDRRTYFP